MNSVDPDRAMRSGDSILGTKLDMDVKTLKTLNRQFCSTETVKANVAKKQKIIVKRVFTYDNRYFEISAAVVSTTTFALILAFIMQMLLYIIAFGTILLTMIVIYGIVVTIQEIWPKPAYPDSVVESAAAGTVEDAIPDIAGGFGNTKCVEAAAAILAYLAAKGLSGRKIEIRFIGGKGWVLSLSKGDRVISYNGYHVGVEYNSIVYCNVHPYGLPKIAWINDFVATGMKTINEIIF